MATSSQAVDIVIPVYNEERMLERSVETLRVFAAEHLPYRWRIVVADNASTDGTLGVARRLAEAHEHEVAWIHLNQKGRGRALKRAWLESVADGMCYMDVDLSSDLKDVLPLLRAVLEEGYDVAYGSRVARAADTRRSLRREVNSRGYITLIKLLFRARFSDAQCGFKAISQNAARRLLPLVEDGEWFFDTELLVLAERLGCRLKEVPVKWVEDKDSRVRFPQDIWRMGSKLVALRFRNVSREGQRSGT